MASINSNINDATNSSEYEVLMEPTTEDFCDELEYTENEGNPYENEAVQQIGDEHHYKELILYQN